jgi:hypothetical protein
MATTGATTLRHSDHCWKILSIALYCTIYYIVPTRRIVRDADKRWNPLIQLSLLAPSFEGASKGQRSGAFRPAEIARKKTSPDLGPYL